MTRLLGIGIYSVPEASRLSGVNANRIRRWVQGYSYTSGGERRQSRPVWRHDLVTLEGRLAVSFRDLIEVRFIDAFRAHGVSWKYLREAADCAAQLLSDSHPFSTKRFKTDGRSIFADVYEKTGRAYLLEVVKSQHAFHEVVSPHLYEGLAFSEADTVERWYPLRGSRRVVIDPKLAFGQPVVVPGGVPTRVLAAAARTERSLGRVQRLYEIDPAAAADAVEYEEQLAA